MLITLWQWTAGLRFPLRVRERPPDVYPPLSLLKPLKGLDSETERCLASWFQQDYPGKFEILFGVASLEDPVCPLVMELTRRHPQVDAKLILCEPMLGPNAKVSSLVHMERGGQYSIVVVSDADVFVQPAFLRHLAEPFSKERAALVNCFYRLAEPITLAARLEAVAMNADFWTQVLQGIQLKPMDFALGAVMAIRRDVLDSIGGFASLVDYLADDYQLGNRVAKAGGRIELLTVPVDCIGGGGSAREVWDHQLRWARTIRVSQPFPYFLSIISNVTLWPAVAWISGAPLGFELFVLAVGLRVVTATWNYRRLTGAGMPIWAGLLAPIKDLFGVLLWAYSFLGNKVTWRGIRYQVTRCGKLAPIA